MSREVSSTAVMFLYRTRPGPNFAGCVAEFDAAFRGGCPIHYRLTWISTDLVFIDVDGSRVSVAREARIDCKDTPDRFDPATCLIVAIGHGPLWLGPTSIADNRTDLLQVIADSILYRHPADLVIWSELDHVFAPEDADHCSGRVNDMHPRSTTPAGPPPVAVTRRHLFEAPDVERLMYRLERQIAASPATLRGEPAADPVDISPIPPPEPSEKVITMSRFHTLSDLPDLPDLPGTDLEPDEFTAAQPAFANSVPDLPHPMTLEMAQIRRALYPSQSGETATDRTAPLPQRLTIYTLNTTLMLIALPVGCAILAYNVLRGENLNASARAIAVAGTVIGLVQTPILEPLRMLQSLI